MAESDWSPISLVPLDSLAVDVLTDDVSDTYVSKTLFAVSEFANVIRGGAAAISGAALLCATPGVGLRWVSSAPRCAPTVCAAPGPEELKERGGTVGSDTDSTLLADGHFYYSGEIPRITAFENGREDHLSRHAPGAPWRPDPLLMDERMLLAHVRGLGLIIFSSCSHAGVVNVCLHAKGLFPEVPLPAVTGG